ncbi:MAG: amidohydrolase [Bacillota bacterium]|nr:amidohydrolase [Bacillota bacterium]
MRQAKLELDRLALERAAATAAEVRRLRRHFHERPETAGQEVETGRFLDDYSQDLGARIERLPGTGLIASFINAKPGPTIALRADIDALQVTESPDNLAGPRSCHSLKQGLSHACGHDAHMAIALGVARCLRELRGHWCGTFLLLFEEGEETGTGIDPMLAALTGRPIGAILGNHVYWALPTGVISATAGPVMAGQVRLEFRVIGSGGHGSRPDLAINPIFAAAAVLQGIATAWPNRLDITRPVTLGLTKIQGGTTLNVIPDEVTIGGTLRFFDAEAGRAAFEVLQKVALQTAAAHGCRVDFGGEPVFHNPLVNDAALAARAEEIAGRLYPGMSQPGSIWYASESFAAYADIAPSLFSFIGITNPAVGSGAVHHSRDFDIDEAVLEPAVAYTTRLLLDLLQEA